MVRSGKRLRLHYHVAANVFLDPTSLVLATLCMVVYLVFDAGRHFLHRISPMRLKQWSGAEPESRHASRWFLFDKEHFSLVSGVFVQGALVAGVAFTVTSLWRQGTLFAWLGAMLVWMALVVGWKLILALVSETSAEKAFHAMLPLSNFLYFALFPLLVPIRLILEAVDRREESAEDDEPTEEEVQAYIDVGEEEGILEEGEGKLIQQIVEFGDRVAKEVMTPRVEIEAIRDDASLDDLGRLFSESKYSRIPVYAETIDNIVGIVHIKDFFDVYLHHQDKKIREIAGTAYFVGETKKVSELLREFQIEHLQIAVVVDEYGGTAGLISIEDLLEEIVGEIADEHEDADEFLFVEIDDDAYLVSGLLKVDELDELLGTRVHSHEDDFETVAGLIFKILGRIPKVGETVTRAGVRFCVDRADRKRIYRVRVDRLGTPGAEGGGAP